MTMKSRLDAFERPSLQSELQTASSLLPSSPLYDLLYFEHFLPVFKFMMGIYVSEVLR